MARRWVLQAGVVVALLAGAPCRSAPSQPEVAMPRWHLMHNGAATFLLDTHSGDTWTLSSLSGSLQWKFFLAAPTPPPAR